MKKVVILSWVSFYRRQQWIQRLNELPKVSRIKIQGPEGHRSGSRFGHLETVKGSIAAMPWVPEKQPGPTQKLLQLHSLPSPQAKPLAFRKTQKSPSEGPQGHPHSFPDLAAHLVIEIESSRLSHRSSRKRLHYCRHVNRVFHIAAASPRPLNGSLFRPKLLGTSRCKHERDADSLKGRTELWENNFRSRGLRAVITRSYGNQAQAGAAPGPCAVCLFPGIEVFQVANFIIFLYIH